MSMAPHLWSRNPVAVSQEFDNRHGAGTLPNSFSWAIWAAEGLDYLEKLDAGHRAGPVPPGGPHPDLLDISHVRWATGNAITAIDLCAATMGRLFCGPPGAKELSLRHFDPACPPKYQAAVTARRASLPPEFLKWVDETLADQRYIDLHGARNPFTHAWLRRHLFDGVGGHADRTQFEVLGTSHQMNARDMVVDSASLALDRVRAFVDVVDQY
jgi:hypothetical protein